MFSVQGNSVFLFANGSMRKVPRCNIQLCDQEYDVSKSFVEGGTQDKRSVVFEEESFGDNIVEKDLEQSGRCKTRSMTDVERRELERDNVSAFWLQVENTECFNELQSAITC